VSFGSPSGRNAYSPYNVNETYRMDMYINAQDEVEVKSEEQERQVERFPGFTLIFEMEKPNGDTDVDAEVFTKANLPLMYRAQQVIEADPRWKDFCLRCPVDEPRACTLAKRAVTAAEALVEALANATTSDVTGAASTAAERTIALCNEVSQTCVVSTCAKQLQAEADDGDHLTTELADMAERAEDCVLAGAEGARDGVCAIIPGCADATADEPVCQRAYSPLNYFYDDNGRLHPDIAGGWRLMDSELDAPEPEQLADRRSWNPASFYMPAGYEKGDRRAHKTRMQLLLGLPLEGYTDANDRFEAQEAKAHAWLIEMYPRLEALRREYDETGHALHLRWVADNAVINIYFMSLLSSDILWAIVALLFVVGYSIYHTRSLFVAALSMAGVVLCFPVACFWAIRVCAISYFDPLNVRRARAGTRPGPTAWPSRDWSFCPVLPRPAPLPVLPATGASLRPGTHHAAPSHQHQCAHRSSD
jgi:hypothetical protein